MQTYMAFFSYSRDDDDLVRGIVNRISVPIGQEQKKAIRIWTDIRDIQPGEVWRDAVAEAVRECTMFIMLAPITPSIQVAIECGMALALKKPIVPIVRDIEHIKTYNLDHIQAITFDLRHAIGTIAIAHRLSTILLAQP